MSQSLNLPNQVSPVIIHLLKGVLYCEQYPEVWRDLLIFQAPVRDYFAVIGLEVYLDETEGYAFLRQLPELEAEEIPDISKLPKLIQRRPLSFPVSLLCVLLRKKMTESDTSGDTRLILSRDQIIEMMVVLLPVKDNEAKTVDQINQTINKVVDYGLLRPLKNQDNHFEVRRIVKAMIDADWLANIDEILKDYQEHGKSLT